MKYLMIDSVIIDCLLIADIVDSSNEHKKKIQFEDRLVYKITVTLSNSIG